MAVKVGMIGLGWAGNQHAKVLSTVTGAEVAAGADPDEERASIFSEKFGVPAYGGMHEMLDKHTDLEAVIVGTDAVTRLEPIRAACERGLALFCEKPPALDLPTASEAKGAIEQAGILNTVGFQSRWSGAATRMRELLDGRTKLFARIVIAWPVFDWVKGGDAPCRLYTKSGCGGPMIEQGIHYQDVLRYITADEPVWVQAMAELGPTHPIEGRDCEDTTIVTARHESGMLSTHVHNWSHTEALLQLQVVGVEFDLTWHIIPGERLAGQIDGRDVNKSFDTDPYVEEIRGFVEAVAKKDQGLLRSPYADACQTLSVCQAANRAVETAQGQAVQPV